MPTIDTHLSFPPWPHIINHKRQQQSPFTQQTDATYVNGVITLHGNGDSSSITQDAAASEDLLYAPHHELSEGGSQSSLRDIEAELRERRLSWLMEIEGRKQAEETLDIMKGQWERLAQKLSVEGLTLPSASTLAVEHEKPEFDPAEALCQQIRLARALSTSVGRRTGKAEAEIELESKNFEIARLSQRLHYYETVNHEISLRNQEATDAARRLTQKRKRRHRWLWSTVGVSVMVGSAALAWYFLPTMMGSPPTDSSHASEGDSAVGRPPN